VALPVLVPELDYKDLEISDGSTAATRFQYLHEGKVVGYAAKTVRKDLTDYCRLDTLAMLRIVARLQALIR